MISRIWKRLRGCTRRPSPPVLASMCHLAPGNQWYDPCLAGPSTFDGDVSSARAVADALAVLDRLESDQYGAFVGDFYRAGLQRFGDRWRYADINTVVMGLARRVRPQTYLEIGVRRGRSLAMLSSVAPECHVVGFDLWIPDYAGMPNPGPGFVERELKRLGHRGTIELVTGPSSETVPRYFAAHPDYYPSMVTVDGDHSVEGAADDLRTVAARIPAGGALVFDDVRNPSHPGLRAVWDEVIAGDPRWSAWTFDEVGFGVSFAIRRRW